MSVDREHKVIEITIVGVHSTASTELSTKSPDVPSKRGARVLLSYWDGLELSSDSFPSLRYDKGTSWDFLILFTFFSFVLKISESGKRC